VPEEFEKDRAITGLAALGGSAAFLEILRRWLQCRQEKRQEQLQLDVRILEEGHALRQEAYQREREALQALAEEARAPPQGGAGSTGSSDAGEAGGANQNQRSTHTSAGSPSGHKDFSFGTGERGGLMDVRGLLTPQGSRHRYSKE
jgi:hypothetical protein